jgi:hypothetical protein
MVESMYDGATVPMSDQFYLSAHFVLPTNWTTPLALHPSQAMLEEIAYITTP